MRVLRVKPGDGEEQFSRRTSLVSSARCSSPRLTAKELGVWPGALNWQWGTRAGNSAGL